MSWLAERAARSSAAEALVIGDVCIDYGELGRRARALQAALHVQGVAPGEAIALLAAGALEVALLLHAAQSLGCTLLALNARLTEPELARQLAASGVRAIVAEPSSVERASALAAGCGIAAFRVDAQSPSLEPTLTHVSGQRLSARHADTLARGEERALLWLFTSGTSGEAKAAELSQRALRASARGHERSIGLATGERWLACMPMFHIGGLSILVRCTLAGASAVLHDRFDEGAVVAELTSGHIALVSLVPTMLARVLDAWGERPPPPRLRCVLLGGAAAPAPLLARAAALGFPIAPTYGLTEAASQVATRAPAEKREPLGGRLRALPGTELRIMNEDGALAPPGSEGEICVRGETLMTRYVGNEVATSRALRDGWLRTGDVGRLDDEGGLEVLDRRTDLIVSGGENVYPAEIENALHEHADVLEAGVVARADERFGARPVAFVVPRPSARIDEVALRAHCAARLARFKTPDAFVFTDALPRNAAGKLLRRELRDRLLRRRP
ncbi:MAG: o-succinylbenzoate--CoA ligase [Deltaproteobacteria bacterium]|nr:o-succinylbenzoate--CoA ligase [Deltaproteobacteria bacterium]